MSQSALKAGVSRTTARKYLKDGQPPCSKPHTWRTRPDPFEAVWPEVVTILQGATETEPWAVFELLQARYPGRFAAGQIRTLQRRIREWKLTHGPEQEVYFQQDHQPGRKMQLDWTHMDSLGITIAGEPYPHKLCHAVLTYSNWQWGTRCLSESQVSFRQGLQQALLNLGRVPGELWIDNSSAATHRIQGEGRQFSSEFKAVCEHFGLEPHTINVACPNENGDVESSHAHLKRRIEQYLLLRGSRDFASFEEYDAFLREVFLKANARVQSRVAEELAVMRELPLTLLPEYRELDCPVSNHSTIRVRGVTYSVPSRLIGAQVRVRIWEDRLGLYVGRELVESLPRRLNQRGGVIDYRHVIGYLVRKPGAFAHYRWRTEMFPSYTFRAAYDSMERHGGAEWADREYLHILKLAADQGQALVERALEDLLGSHKNTASLDEVRRMIGCYEDLRQQALTQPALVASLCEYDQLLEQLDTPEVIHVN